MEFVKRSFSGGEISPELHARADLLKFTTGVKELTNFFVKPEGGAFNRAGFEFINEVKTSSDEGSRLIPFEFNTEQTYILEFGDGYIRFYTNGGVVLDNMSVIYEIATPYAKEDLARLQYTQSADVMTIVHPNYKVRELSRLDNDNWTLSVVDYGTTVNQPTGTIATAVGTTSTSDDKTYQYVVTAVRGGVESQASTDTKITMDAQSVTWGAKISWTAPSGGADYYNVYKAEVVDSDVYGWIGETKSTWFDDYNIAPIMTEGVPVYRDPLTQQDIEVDDPDSLAIGQIIEGQTSGATATIEDIVGNKIIIKDVTGEFEVSEILKENFFPLSFSSLVGTFEQGETVTGGTSGATATVKVFIREVEPGFPEFEFFSVENVVGTFTLAETVTGSTSGATAVVDSTGASSSVTVTAVVKGNYPSTVNYYQQRILFGSTLNEPQTVYTSRSGNYKDFRVSSPTQDDDAVTFTIASEQVNEIRHIVNMSILMVLTSGGAWRITEGRDDVLTPATVGAKRQTEHGANWVKPVTVGDSVLYVQEQGARIRDLVYTFERDKYTGNDITKFARHLFDGFEIVDWTYADEPHGIVWAVRDDGKIIAVTYDPQEQVLGWHVHETNGTFESIASVREGAENRVYVIVKRTINGETKRYVERLHARESKAVEDCFFVDSGLSYDGAPTTAISGLDHLEGEEITVLADGNVVGGLTVSGGAITLPNASSKVHAGLSYTSRIKTLRVDQAELNSLGKNKKADKLAIRFIESRGGWLGQENRHIDEIKWRDQIDNYNAIALRTTEIDRPLSQGWSKDASIVIEQRDPLPMGVLNIMPKVTIGG